MLDIAKVAFSDGKLESFYIFLIVIIVFGLCRNKRPEFTAWLAEVKQVFGLTDYAKWGYGFAQLVPVVFY